MKYKIEELKDAIKDIENEDDGLSKEQKIDKILEEIERCIVRYPEWVDKPGNDRYYGMALILFKSQMLLVKEALEKLKDNIFIVLVSYGLLINGEQETTYVYNVSYSEETAWTAIERDINDRVAENKLGKLYINIYPESRFIRVTLPIHCGCDDTDIIYKYYDYKIIIKPITD